jgi:MFS family permease
MRDLRLLTLVSALTFAAMGLTMPVMTVYLETLGASFAQISLIMTSFTLTALLTNYASGWLSDRMHRRKPLLVVGLLLIALAYFWLGRVLDATEAWPLRILEGIGSGAYGTLSLAMTGDLLEDSSRRGRSMGILRGLGSVAFAVGAVLGGWLSTRLTSSFVFAAAGGCYAAAALVMMAVREHSRPTLVSEREPLGAPSGYSGLGLPLLFLTGVFLWTSAVGAFTSMWANAMKHAGYSQQAISTLWGLAALIELPGMTAAGAISDIVGRAPLLAVGGLGIALVFGSYIFVIHWLPAVIAAQVGRGLSYGSYLANAMTYTAEHGNRLTRGSVSGVFSAATGSGQLAGMLAGGFIVQAFGFTSLFALCALAGLSAGICFIVLHRSESPAGRDLLPPLQ